MDFKNYSDSDLRMYFVAATQDYIQLTWDYINPSWDMQKIAALKLNIKDCMSEFKRRRAVL